MKLTKSKLKQFIKKELKEGLHSSDREIQQAFYDILVDNGLEGRMAETLLSNIGMNTLKSLLRLLEPTESDDETY